MRTSKSRILYLDAYDSFSNNITSLLARLLNAQITTIRIDDPRFLHHQSVFHDFLHDFSAVVAGPGPGDPRNPSDVGLIDEVWRLSEVVAIPVLGICLGFQSLVLNFGGNVERLTQPRHGIARPVSHRDEDLFMGTGRVLATQYHSLHCRLAHGDADAKSDAIWGVTGEDAELQPLAWDISDAINGPVLMAVKHVSRPYWGLQYHPESVCTNSEGSSIIVNWWRAVEGWNSNGSSMRCVKRRKLEHRTQGLDSGYASGTELEDSVENVRSLPTCPPKLLRQVCNSTQTAIRHKSQVLWTAVRLAPDEDHLPAIVSVAEAESSQWPLVLESGTKRGHTVRSETGRFSIVGIVEEDHHELHWSTVSQRLRHTKGDRVLSDEQASVTDAFTSIQQEVQAMSAEAGPPELPFWGGLIGYISYEAGLGTINVPPSKTISTRPDMHFMGIRRSIVLDHVERLAYCQSLDVNDERWIRDVSKAIEDLQKTVKKEASVDQIDWTTVVERPARDVYCKKVKQCQTHIRAGDSYELCLTSRSRINFRRGVSQISPRPWDVYQRLRISNPAPYGAFLDLGDVAIMSSSPERFLSWSRDGRCEFRPIKGTVQKGPGMTKERAEAILKTDKEQAENLMIVDLIRHDLNGVLSSIGREARVSKLMQVEEYETVFQLVSVIEGQLKPAARSASHRNDPVTADPADEGLSGIDVLRASLPPGSMTGAPKKRSCELLQELEGGQPRGIYSGVLGYLDAGGGGDFSVVIRSIIREGDEWSIGAGGAVTALSEPDAEYEEMMAKSTAVRV